LHPSLKRAFGEASALEGKAFAKRAPIDIRVNTLKSDRETVLGALAQFGAALTSHSPVGISVPPPGSAGRQPHLESEAAHGKGWFEVQDEGSQIAAMMAGQSPE
jgi:16S rRNA (cytosine967-C5)-methyltransferase